MKKRIEFENDSEKTKKIEGKENREKGAKNREKKKRIANMGNGQLFVPICF